MNYDTLSNEELDRICTKCMPWWWYPVNGQPWPGTCYLIYPEAVYVYHRRLEENEDYTSGEKYSPSTNTDQAIEFAETVGEPGLNKDTEGNWVGAIYEHEAESAYAIGVHKTAPRALVIATLKALDAKEKV